MSQVYINLIFFNTSMIYKMQQGKCLIQDFHFAAVKWGSNTFYSMLTLTNSISYSKETPDMLHIILKVTEKIQKMFVEATRPRSYRIPFLLPMYENYLNISVDFIQVTLNVFQIKVRNSTSILCWNKARGKNQLLPPKYRQHLSFITTTRFLKLQKMPLWGHQSTRKRHPSPQSP